MLRTISWFALALGVLATTFPANAQNVPPLLNFGGVLTDAAGQPLATGSYGLDVSVFEADCAAAPCGDQPVWGPVSAAVEVVNGAFDLVLHVDTGGDPITEAFRGPSRFVQLAVDGGAPVLPRQEVLSTAFVVQADNGLAVGSIVPFAGSVPPAGFLLCDGSAVSRATYAALFAAVGTTWGEGDGASTFNLPDLRGVFLRGLDAASGRDPDAGSRTASAPGGNSGDAVGSMQTDALNQHRHRWGRTTSEASGFDRDIISFNAAGSEITVANGTPQSSMNDGSNQDDAVSFASNAQLYTSPEVALLDAAAETRPVNAAVAYLIRY